MKLSITQIVLGVLVVIASLYITGWMILDAPEAHDQFNTYVSDLQKLPGITSTNHTMNEDLFSLARFSSFLLPILGIVLVSIGIAQIYGKTLSSIKTSITNISAGLVIIGVLVLISGWGYPFGSPIFVSSNVSRETVELLLNTRHQDYIPLTISRFTVIMFLFAVVVIVIGIIQLITSRKKVNA
jgi:hypothetical protein